MSIEKELTERLKAAMRAKNAQELGVIRMVKTFATKEKTSPGFKGDADDAFWLDVIAKYVKQQKKALAEFEKIGAENEQVGELKFEIEYLTPFLPAKLSREETETLVEQAIAATGADSIRLMGKVMGYIMKDHKDAVDGALVKEVISTKLS